MDYEEAISIKQFEEFMVFTFEEAGFDLEYHENDMLDLFQKIDVDDDNHLGRIELYQYFPKLKYIEPPKEYGYEIDLNQQPDPSYEYQKEDFIIKSFKSNNT